MTLALRNILSDVKPIGVLKCRFKSEEVTIYGLMMFIFNYRLKRVLRYASVAGCNPVAYEIDMEQPWFVFEKNLYSQRLKDGSLREVSQKFEQKLLKDIQEDRIEEFYDYWNTLDHNMLSSFFKDSIKNIIHHDTGLDCKVDFEFSVQKLNLRQFKYLTDIEKSDSEFKIHMEDDSGSSPFIALNSSLVKQHENASTIRVEKIEAGDVVFTEIIDDRDIGVYLAYLLGAKKGEVSIPLSASVEDVKETDEGIEVIVRYGPGILGRVTENPKKKVAVLQYTIADSFSWGYLVLIALAAIIYYILFLY